MALTPPVSPANTPYDGYAFGEPNRLTSYPHGVVMGSIARNTSIALLTSAQLLALQTTAIQLVGTPLTPPHGFGKSVLLVPTRMTLQYIFNTTAYTIGNADNAFQIEYTGKSTSLMKTNATGLVDQVVNEVITVEPAVAGQVLAQSNAAGLGLEVKLTGTAPALTLGDGAVVLSLEFNGVIMS